MTQPTNTDYKSIEEHLENEFPGYSTPVKEQIIKFAAKRDAIARQQERDKWSAWLQHDVACYLYLEEGDSDDCTCGLTYAITTPNDKE